VQLRVPTVETERFPSWEGKRGRQALGVGCGAENEPTPALRDRCRCAPPLQGGDLNEVSSDSLPQFLLRPFDQFSVTG
jgi:hypothetical protein